MLQKITTVLFLVTSIFYRLSAQNQDLKVLLWDETQPDTTRFNAVDELVAHFQGHGGDSMLWLSDQLKRLAEKNNKPEWSTFRYQIIGAHYLNLGKADSTLIMSNLAIPFAKKCQNPVHLSKAYILEGLAKAALNDLDGGKISFREAYNVLDKKIYPGDAAYARHYEGVLEAGRDNYLEALNLLQESIRLAEATNRLSTKAFALNSIGDIFEKLGVAEEAKAAYKEAGELFGLLDDPYGTAFSKTELLDLADNEQDARKHFSEGIKITQEYQLLDVAQSLYHIFGNFHLEHQQIDSALVYLKKAAELAQKINDEGAYLIAVTDISNIHIKTGKVKEGIRQLETITPKLEQLEDYTSLLTAYEGLSMGYKQQGKISQAFFYLEKCVAIKDSLYNSKLTQKITRQYLNELHEKEKAQLTAQNALNQLETATELRQQRTLSWGLGVFLLLLGTLAYVFFKNMKERKMAAEQLQVLNDRLRSEGELLQKSNQMLHGFALSVSHDILNNIDLILSNGNILVANAPTSKNLTLYYEQTQRIGHQLKDYCTSLLDSARNYHKQQSQPTLSDPNAIVQQILERFEPLLQEKNFSVQFEPLSPATLPLAVVSQVFQNLISNSIRYAGDQPAPVLRIATETNEQHDKAFWVIEDNGPGITEAQLTSLLNTAMPSTKGHGIGLIQVKSMLSKFGADISVLRGNLGGARFEIHFG